MQYDLRILNISLYGSGLSRTDEAFSGASDRQVDYATFVTELVHIVPSATGSVAPVHHSDNCVVYPVTTSGVFSFYISAYKKARALGKEQAFDVVMSDNPHIGGVCGWYIALRLRALFVLHSMADIIGNPWYRKERLSNILKAVLIALSVRLADVIRVSTQSEYERLKKKSYGKKVYVVPFYIDSEAFLKRLNEAKRIVNDQILYVGRLGPQKDVETLIRAFSYVHKQLPHASLVLVGDGPKRASLESLSEKLHISEHVHFKGAVPYPNIPQYFREAKLFAVTSLYEGTCMVLHEGAAAELPLIATDFAGAKDFIRSGTEGYIAPVRDHKRLGELMVELLRDEAKREAMGSAAHTRLHAFGRESALSCWEALVSDLQQRSNTHNGTQQ